MLLGQNVNSYGKNLEEPMTFAQLLTEIEKIEGLERIRFMTSHPKDLSDELIEVMGCSKKICKHLHLPVQSGSTRILEKMNRRYTKEQYLDLVERIRRAVPDISLTTDIIVGFPGETEEEFEASRAFVERVSFYETHIFKYSRREGTRAAVMKDQVPEQIKAKRSAVLIGLGHEKQNEYERKYTGREVEVLIEETAEIGGKEVWIGHTKEYIKVAVSSEENLQNRIVKGTVGKDLQIIH